MHETTVEVWRCGSPGAIMGHGIRRQRPCPEGDDVTEPVKGKRITGANRDKYAADLRKKYEGGQSIRALAATTGRSYGFVHRMLGESGAALRGRGGATRKAKP